ncbi:hypothetical protein MVEN_01821100 [Mycena venus]|uniref:Uncharacterized protein n=1 Tax=Mycena venus TaxID=2733690 RepID=A0A8H7CNE2_9AGAR|nr:hypothetical protein MVEN_01821100 [Mycena venus]
MRFFAFVSAALATMAVVNAMSVDTTQNREADIDTINQISEINKAHLLKSGLTETRRSDINGMSLDKRVDLNALLASLTQVLKAVAAQLKGTPVGGIVTSVVDVVATLLGTVFDAVQSILGDATGGVAGLSPNNVGISAANAGYQGGTAGLQAGNAGVQAGNAGVQAGNAGVQAGNAVGNAGGTAGEQCAERRGERSWKCA